MGGLIASLALKTGLPQKAVAGLGILALMLAAVGVWQYADYRNDKQAVAEALAESNLQIARDRRAADESLRPALDEAEAELEARQDEMEGIAHDALANNCSPLDAVVCRRNGMRYNSASCLCGS